LISKANGMLDRLVDLLHYFLKLVERLVSGLTIQMKKLILKKGLFPDDLSTDLLKAKSILVELGARKIILYGSLARGDYQPHSDIDICVDGIPKESYFRAIARCMMEIDRRISILEFEKIQGYFKERILSEGKILYEV